MLIPPVAGGKLKQVTDSPIRLMSIASRQKCEKPSFIRIWEMKKYPYLSATVAL